MKSEKFIVEANSELISNLLYEIELLEMNFKIGYGLMKSHDMFLKNKNFYTLFGIIQRNAILSIYLSTTKLLEKPSKTYVRLSIPNIINSLKQDCENFAKKGFISNHYHNDRCFAKKHKVYDSSEPFNPTTFGTKLLGHYENKFNDYMDFLKINFKPLRNKNIAHMEKTHFSFYPVDFDKLEELIKLMKEFTADIGALFFNYLITDFNGKYYNYHNPISVNNQLKELVSMLYPVSHMNIEF